MWLVKKAAAKVYSVSQNVIRERSPAQKLIEEIIGSSQAIPVRKMAELAQLSFHIEQFEVIVQTLQDKLKQIKFQFKSLKKRLNILVLISYLIKYGAGGFIDEFRNMINDTFRRYEDIANFIAQGNPQIHTLLEQIRQRAKYIRILLLDNSTLQREKQVARLIREKLFIQHGDYTSLEKQKEDRKESNKSVSEKIDNFLEHYVWRYTQKIDRKLDKITDILIAKIDLYLEGEIPQNFEIEQDQFIPGKPNITKSQFEFGGQAIKNNQNKFIQQKLLICSDINEIKQQINLIDSQPIKNQKIDLIDLSEEVKKQNEVKLSNQTDLLNDEQIQAFRNELLK